MSNEKQITIKLSVKAFNEVYQFETCGELMEHRDKDENGQPYGLSWYKAVKKGNYYYITDKKYELTWALENAIDILSERVGDEGELTRPTFDHLVRTYRRINQ